MVRPFSGLWHVTVVGLRRNTASVDVAASSELV
jgi:hypothetical protein